jgi:putative hydrolase of the HAD superfamily
MSLKAVIFDFGGVLARTRSQHLRQAWEQRLSLRRGEASELVFGGESGRAAQHGWISDTEHWTFIQRRLGLDDATLTQFRRDFFAEDGIDTDLLAYIDRLRSGYRVGLLSNATTAARRFFTESGIAAHFDAITISGEEGVMKPDARIYRIALGRLDVKPNEAIFVDDFNENVIAARALGMAGVHFADPQQARRELMILTGVE